MYYFIQSKTFVKPSLFNKKNYLFIFCNFDHRRSYYNNLFSNSILTDVLKKWVNVHELSIYTVWYYSTSCRGVLSRGG